MDIFKGFNTDGSTSRDADWVALTQDAQGGWVPKGPYSTDEIKKLMQKGSIKPTDYCWKQGWKDWRRIYEESSFYHSRKPPIEIKTVKKESIEFAPEKTTQYRAEIAETISPQQEEKKIKPKKSSSMLEPWESVKGLDFTDAQEDGLSLLGESAPPEELSPDSLKKVVAVDEDLDTEIKPAFWKRRSTHLLMAGLLVIALVLDFQFDGRIKSWWVGPQVDLVVSYITVQDYSLETPRHLMVRTDLKKGQRLVVRLLDIDEKPIFTLKGGAGLIIPSKGTGQMRIPLYPYDLKPGSYKVWVQAKEAEVVKTFVIPDPAEVVQPQEDSTINSTPEA